MISNSCATTSCYTTASRTSTHPYWWISCTRALLSWLPFADFRRHEFPSLKMSVISRTTSKAVSNNNKQNVKTTWHGKFLIETVKKEK